MKHILSSLFVSILLLGSARAETPQAKDAKVTVVYQHELPNVPGKSIKGVLVEYGPGGYSPGHTHAKSAFIYATVLEGSIRSQINGGPVTTYTAGQNFSELPGDRHSVSANASETKPAKLLAVFVVDTNDKDLTTQFGNSVPGVVLAARAISTMTPVVVPKPTTNDLMNIDVTSVGYRRKPLDVVAISSALSMRYCRCVVQRAMV